MKKGSRRGGGYGLEYNKMKDSQQINFRNRLSNYYRYLFNKAEKDEPFEYIKVIHDPHASSPSQHAASSSLPSVHDTQRSQNMPSRVKIHATIDSNRGKKTRRSSQSPHSVRFPSIHSPSIDITSPQQSVNSPSPSDWQKYYNVHELSTIKLDQHTIELIEGNQRRAKAHPGSQRP